MSSSENAHKRGARPRGATGSRRRPQLRGRALSSAPACARAPRISPDHVCRSTLWYRVSELTNAAILIAWAALVAAATAVLPRVWRGRLRAEPFVLHGLSDAGFRACVRVTALVVAIGWLMLLAFAWTLDWLPGSGSVRESVLVVLVTCMGLVAAAAVVVGLWNRPRFLVPPGMRSEPGYLRARVGTGG